MSEVMVYPATDATELVELINGYLTFYERPLPEGKLVLEHISFLLAHPSLGRQFVAKLDGVPVGFATLYFTFSTLRLSKVAILNDLFVVPNGRRKGIGEQLFRACQAYVTENGYAYMEWVTHPDNQTARQFYAKLGAQAEPWVVYSV